MDQDRFSFRNLALNYLCLYGVFYPLLAHLLMEAGGTGGVGSTPVHFLQLSAFIAFWGIAKFNKETLQSGIDVWIVASLYFACEAFFLAVFFAEDAKTTEIAYAARFIMWFLFAAIVTRGALGIQQLERLSFSFLIGTFIQGMLAIWAFNTQSVGSTYKGVYATTGGVNVSGKTIVSFVIIGIFLAFYWALVRPRRRWIYIVSLFVGILVILFSYNRATQLSFALVLLFDAFWLFRGRKIRSFFLVGIAAIAIGAFLTSSWGESFLLRWQSIRVDGGSGRVTLVRAALEGLADPESMRSLLFGRGNRETRLLMFRACGAYIGTHSDLFDFLTMYGLIGGAFYVWIALKILTLGRELPHRSIEYLCIRSTGAFVILAGLMTGSFQSTYTFVMFFTVCQYWLERGRLVYGVGGGAQLDGIVPFSAPPELDSNQFHDYPEPFADFSSMDGGDFTYERDLDEAVCENDVREIERPVSNREVSAQMNDIDDGKETVDSVSDFNTLYSVINPEIGHVFPLLVVEGRPQDDSSGFPNEQNLPIENVRPLYELEITQDGINLDQD